MNKWNRYFMDVARLTAQLSHARRLKVGAVAARENRLLLTAYNGTPPGMSNTCELVNPDGTYGPTLPQVLHAEENLIAVATRFGVSLDGASVYLTHSPCIHCAGLLLSAGITRVFYELDYRCSEGIEYLRQNDIMVVKI